MAQSSKGTTGHAPEFAEFATFAEAEREAARLRSLMIDHWHVNGDDFRLEACPEPLIVRPGFAIHFETYVR